MKEPRGYYNNVNHDLLARLNGNASRVLEIGCGSGALARAYRERNPDAHYTGVELAEAPASEATASCNEVVLGNIETRDCLAALDHRRGNAGWDLIVCGDVLEHLQDPLAVLCELRARTVRGGECVACIPNIGHVSVIHGLLRARFDYADSGLLDRTHLRFFTQPTMVALFTQAGWQVSECTARVFQPEAVERAIEPLLALAPTLGLNPDAMRVHLSAYQWIVRAANPG